MITMQEMEKELAIYRKNLPRFASSARQISCVQLKRASTIRLHAPAPAGMGG